MLWALLAFLFPAMRPVTAATTPAASPSDPQKQTTRSPHGPLSIPCENCHTASGWRPIRAVPEFDHNKTKYPLRGMHEKVQCVQCHAKPVFTDIGKNCADCHADIHRRQMGSDCAQCHTVQGWNIAPRNVKDHDNRFPLFGAHATVPCDSCHKSAAVGQFLGLRTQCDSCHFKDWQNTTNPNHPSAGPAFASSNCQQCHLFDTWLGAKFDHSTTGFALTNGHANVPCSSCHINNNYNLTIAPTDCGNSGCHLTTWQQTNNPTHSTAGPAFATANCTNCHNTVSWTASTFDHSTTGFLLTQGHANVPCASCHINNNYNLTIAPTNCGNSGCHLTTWQQTNNPVHSTSGAAFAASNCSTCHTPAGWDSASFDHSTTGFALVGTHMSPTPTPCASCHISNNYTLNSTDCLSCHQPDWNKTQTLGGNVPNHITSNFPTSAAACSSCHTITVWSDGKFDHSTTGWPLTGSHQLAPAGRVTTCAQCHSGGNYTLSSANTDCYGCHQTDWTSTQSLGGNVPNHITAGFPTSQCSTCHDTLLWADGKFDHSATGWPLTGAHADPTKAPCSACHINGNYTLTSANTACYGCHQAAWQSTQTLGGSVPNHVAAGFPLTCDTSGCHTTSSWLGATFNHGPFFPIPHHGSQCNDCHQVSTDFTSFTCINCHTTTAHTQNDTDPKHGGVVGYSYGATTCYNCHKNGGGG